MISFSIKEVTISFFEKKKITNKHSYAFPTSVKDAYIRSTEVELMLKEPQSVVQPLHTEVK